MSDEVPISETLEHRQSRITHPTTRKRVAVDAGIAPLLQALWRRDIDTIMSCENNEGMVWIMFPFSHAAEEFLTIAGPTAFWKYNGYPQWYEQFERFILAISVRFPLDDYERVLAQFS